MPTDRKQWAESIAVGIVVAATTFFFFEIIRSQLPGYLQTAIERADGLAACVVVAPLGLSLLCGGMSAISVSGVRLWLALRKLDASPLPAAAKSQLGSVATVVLGFILTVGSLYLISQVKP